MCYPLLFHWLVWQINHFHLLFSCTNHHQSDLNSTLSRPTLCLPFANTLSGISSNRGCSQAGMCFTGKEKSIPLWCRPQVDKLIQHITWKHTFIYMVGSTVGVHLSSSKTGFYPFLQVFQWFFKIYLFVVVYITVITVEFLQYSHKHICLITWSKQV